MARLLIEVADQVTDLLGERDWWLDTAVREEAAGRPEEAAYAFDTAERYEQRAIAVRSV